YLVFKRLGPLRKIPNYAQGTDGYLAVLIMVLAGVTVLVFIAGYGFVMDELRRPNWMQSPYSVGVLLAWKKVFFLIPFAGIVLCFQYFKKKKKKGSNYLAVLFSIGFFILLLVWFKNPLTEKRNALGPIYLCLIYLFVPRLFNSNLKTFSLLTFLMIIAFPLTAIFTHSDATLQEIVRDPGIFFEQSKGGGIYKAFTTLNYDAFANFSTTIDYVRHNGLSWGCQLLSALLFFVPRSIWAGKPIGTGEFIGDYLVSDYGYHFTNLSNPYVSEGYINFGWLGIVFFAIVLAAVFIVMGSWLKSGDYLIKIMAFYLAMHMIYLLRGDLGSSYSYYVGTLVGVLVIPKTVLWFLKRVHKKNFTWEHKKT
ncbi:MAG: hypothetical protein ACPGQR_08885, partial [Marinirhabdus sp.]